MKYNKIIRILQVGMSPYYGGTESFLMSQYRAIDRTKVQFDFLNVYNKKIACQDEIEKLGGKIYYLDMARHHGIRTYYKKLDSFFSENARKFDVVHCNFQSLINTDILKYAKKYGIKVRIAHAHNSGYGTEPSKKQKLLIALNRITLGKYATHYFACSSLAAKWMFRKNAIIIKNAIDIEKYSYSGMLRKEIRKKLELDDRYVVIFVGRLDPQKNPIFLLEIFAELKKIKPMAKLLVVGDGILRDEMNDKIKELDIMDSVDMLGSRKDVSQLLQAADVFLLPSKFEGLGIVLIEAQAVGLPTFTSEGVVPKEAKITDLLTFISLNNSALNWAEEICKYKINKRVDMTEVIRNSGYDISENAVRLLKIYQKIIGGSK